MRNPKIETRAACGEPSIKPAFERSKGYNVDHVFFRILTNIHDICDFCHVRNYWYLYLLFYFNIYQN